MKMVRDIADMIEADGGPAEPGHDAWVRAKVLKGLEQSHDRSKMIPVEQVLRDLNV